MLRINVPEELIVDTRIEFKEKVLSAAGATDPVVVLDFTETSYIDSSGLGALKGLQDRLQARGGELLLEGMNKDLVLLLHLTKLGNYFFIKRNNGDLPVDPSAYPALDVERQTEAGSHLRLET